MANIAENYRPHCWDDVVGQDSIKSQIATIRATSGLIGQAFWLQGASGVGKTTIARILADEVQPFLDRNEIDAADLSLDQIREWEELCRRPPIGCAGWSFIVNEAHMLRPASIERLLTTLEKPVVVKHSFWCFTTSEKLLFGVPFGSRVDEFTMSQDERVTLDFAIRLREIAQKENLDGQPLDKYVELVRRHHHNFRSSLHEIARGGMSK